VLRGPVEFVGWWQPFRQSRSRSVEVPSACRSTFRAIFVGTFVLRAKSASVAAREPHARMSRRVGQ
jgi:hypothetical protein